MKIPKHVEHILTALEAAGHEVWCVGGCVRDALSGRAPEDWDVTASARPEETMAIFGSQAEPTGLAHGTVTVKTEGGPVEVTTYRIDGAYRDHRRPESVVFTGSVDKDLARRDFTVNAMALNLRGELRDPFGGFRRTLCGFSGDCGFSRPWVWSRKRKPPPPWSGIGNCWGKLLRSESGPSWSSC